MKCFFQVITSILVIFYSYNTQLAHGNSIKQENRNLPFNKVVIWGHKLHSHTHSYIHYGFYRTFKYLGYETYWLDNNDNIKNFDFSKTLFITEGQVDQKIPIRNDCFYILHNCNSSKYKQLFKKGLCIMLQVYTHDCKKCNLEKIDNCILYNVNEKIIYMPWATDLLPYEIDEIKLQMPFTKTPHAYFVGSKQGGAFSNDSILDQFSNACQENNIQFKTIQKVSPEKNVKLIQTSLLAPALQGSWQCKQGYIPCRIFKNISYGALGITNSKTVYELFNKKIIYNPNAYQLCYDALERLKTISLAELHETMDFVKTKHTYINRIEALLTLFEPNTQEQF